MLNHQVVRIYSMQTFSVIGDMAAVVAYEFNTNVELTEVRSKHMITYTL